MDKIFFIAAMVSILAVVGSLVGGLLAMTKISGKDHRTSQKMMRMRVSFQVLAILFLFLAYLTKN